MRDTLKFLGGSVAVYLIVAACTGSARRGSEASNDERRGGAPGVGGVPARGGAAGEGTSPGGESSGGMMGTAGVDDPGNDRGGGGPRDDAGPSDSGILDGMIDPIPDAMADSGSTSGTRLKARYYAGADGSIQSGIGWYDSQRNENCFFQTASDGTLRCLPSGEASGAGVYFVDASCTTEELVTIGATGCVVTPKYASRYVTQTDPCSVSRLRVYSVGSEFTGNHYVKIGTMCTAATPNAGLRYFRLGAEVDPSSFVRATEEVEQ